MDSLLGDLKMIGGELKLRVQLVYKVSCVSLIICLGLLRL